jgi:hypothetical protein
MSAKAGIRKPVELWIPACAGMTTKLAIDHFPWFGIGSTYPDAWIRTRVKHQLAGVPQQKWKHR